jgi:hypothetical protein
VEGSRVPKASRKDVVRLGLQQRRFMVRKLDPTMKLKLESLDAFGQALLQAVPPKTTEQWEEEVVKLQLALKGPPKVAGFSNGSSSYRSLWIIRHFAPKGATRQCHRQQVCCYVPGPAVLDPKVGSSSQSTHASC